MDRAFIRISPENMITVALMSGMAYLGVVGASMVVKAVKSKGSAAVAAASTGSSTSTSGAST